MAQSHFVSCFGCGLKMCFIRPMDISLLCPSCVQSSSVLEICKVHEQDYRKCLHKPRTARIAYHLPKEEDNKQPQSTRTPMQETQNKQVVQKVVPESEQQPCQVYQVMYPSGHFDSRQLPSDHATYLFPELRS